MSFVHLHLHTNFSFGDGACRIDKAVARAAELGMPALAVTDHEGLYGAVRFYQACKAAGIKPIVGVELTVEPVVSRDGRPKWPGEAQPARPAGSSEAASAAAPSPWPPLAGAAWPAAEWEGAEDGEGPEIPTKVSL